jgi:ABC-type nitrate/sulfonate/bicarbonate transport system substrate-binding protein
VTDCAPLVYAQEAGLFARYGLDVELRRETRCADLRDKVIYGELDAAHVPGPIPFLANLGIESDHCSCVSSLVLNLQGNAITVSSGYRTKGFGTGKRCEKQFIEAGASAHSRSVAGTRFRRNIIYCANG